MLHGGLNHVSQSSNSRSILGLASTECPLKNNAVTLPFMQLCGINFAWYGSRYKLGWTNYRYRTISCHMFHHIPYFHHPLIEAV